MQAGQPDVGSQVGLSRADGLPSWQSWLFALCGAGFAVAGIHVLRANDLAGVLTLLIPPTAALAWGAERHPGGRSLGRLLGGLGVALALLVLVGTRSRGGLLSLVVAFVVFAVLRLVWTRRRGLLALLATVGGGALLLLPVSRRWLLVPWLDGVQGLSWNSLLTGRPAIWYRAGQAAVDFSLTGLPDFGRRVPRLYPWPAYLQPGGGVRPPVEDTHNLALQLVLDFGLLGLLAGVLLTVGAVWRLLRARRAACCARDGKQDEQLRLWTEGLLAAIAGHLVYGLFDVLAFGTLGFWVPVLILGLAWTVPVPERARQRRRSHRPVLVTATVLGLAVGWWASVDLARQRAQLRVVESLDGGAVPDELARLDGMFDRRALRASPLACRADWWRGLAAQAAGQWAQRDASWIDLARCVPSMLPLLRAGAVTPSGVAPSAALARRVRRHVAETATPAALAQVDLWLADALALRDEIPSAAHRYRQVLRERPRDGQIWLRLAGLSAETDPRAALDAFELACRFGDPGANACVGGAELAKDLGLFERAGRLRARSRWQSTRR